MVAWYMLSNESYMNLVMRDVFPTVAKKCLSVAASACWRLGTYAIPLCSPKNTNLAKF